MSNKETYQVQIDKETEELHKLEDRLAELADESMKISKRIAITKANIKILKLFMEWQL